MSEKHLCICTFTIECTYWGNKEHTGVVLVPRCFFFFFLFCQPGAGLLRNLGPCPLQSRGPSAPTNLCGSPHSLEFSLKVRPEETHYRHL